MQNIKRLTKEQANKVFDILVEYGARSDDRYSFISYLSEQHENHEFRFRGIFGFGGKFRLNGYSGFQADYYPESHTVELDLKMVELKKKLKTLYNEMFNNV